MFESLGLKKCQFCFEGHRNMTKWSLVENAKCTVTNIANKLRTSLKESQTNKYVLRQKEMELQLSSQLSFT
jgi:hypothetical protein